MLKRKIKRFLKSIKEDISHGHALIVSGMLFLIFAQLTWWLVFFEINQKKSRELLSRYHSLFNDSFQGKLKVETYSDLISLKDGAPVIKSDIADAMQEEHKKYLIMLISETTFTLLVISYGSFRVIRS
ncbi:MAG: hypothetical protein OEZ34_06375, partial [Spirochaetia bacterium]|nr:hypothetical protein [Spirochaetia bacterium]